MMMRKGIILCASTLAVARAFTPPTATATTTLSEINSLPVYHPRIHHDRRPRRSTRTTTETTSTTLSLFSSDNASLMMIAAASETESWRQYVPLVVSALVIADVALGSPAANAVLGKVRPRPEGDDDNDNSNTMQQSNARIDVDQVAQAALYKASATLELKKMLEDNKSDWDKIEDIKRKMDNEIDDYDNNNSLK